MTIDKRAYAVVVGDTSEGLPWRSVNILPGALLYAGFAPGDQVVILPREVPTGDLEDCPDHAPQCAEARLRLATREAVESCGQLAEALAFAESEMRKSLDDASTYREAGNLDMSDLAASRSLAMRTMAEKLRGLAGAPKEQPPQGWTKTLKAIQALCRNEELGFDPRSGIDRLCADALAAPKAPPAQPSLPEGQPAAVEWRSPSGRSMDFMLDLAAQEFEEAAIPSDLDKALARDLRAAAEHFRTVGAPTASELRVQEDARTQLNSQSGTSCTALEIRARNFRHSHGYAYDRAAEQLMANFAATVIMGGAAAAPVAVPDGALREALRAWCVANIAHYEWSNRNANPLGLPDPVKGMEIGDACESARRDLLKAAAPYIRDAAAPSIVEKAPPATSSFQWTPQDIDRLTTALQIGCEGVAAAGGIAEPMRTMAAAEAAIELARAALQRPEKAPAQQDDVLVIEFEREDDDRWIADIPAHPGVMAYGTSKSEALLVVVRVLCGSLEEHERPAAPAQQEQLGKEGGEMRARCHATALRVTKRCHRYEGHPDSHCFCGADFPTDTEWPHATPEKHPPLPASPLPVEPLKATHRCSAPGCGRFYVLTRGWLKSIGKGCPHDEADLEPITAEPPKGEAP